MFFQSSMLNIHVQSLSQCHWSPFVPCIPHAPPTDTQLALIHDYKL